MHIPDAAVFAAVIAGYVIGLPIARLTGALIARLTGGMAVVALLVLLCDAAIVIGVIWGTVFLVEKHQFFAEMKGGQQLLIFGWILWAYFAYSAFRKGEKVARVQV